MTLADMQVLEPYPPPKLLKACAVIAKFLHPTFERQHWIARNKSKSSCVLCALTVRDFLLQLGFADAQVRPVSAIMMAFNGAKMLHSLAIGSPDDDRFIEGYWTGHLITTVAGYLIDTTLYPTIRPQWRDNVTGMLTIPIVETASHESMLYGLLDLTGAMVLDGRYKFCITYLDNPTNIIWAAGPDAQNALLKRVPIVRELRQQFGIWEGIDYRKIP